ncbi:TPA: hypothetical protein NJ626_000253 [Vibrio parahaemolyticus]|uniref:hypothetical protein n=1 Tax=Vibrio parahaemolyticus TaxID=670 RepID=UPI00301C9882|nr:hypothetical protein [Vibrio parahaemolyticus]HCM1516425.1 hypothetical protein [Vibrio parahaemolyticus]
MTLQELVLEQFPSLEIDNIRHLPLCDIFTITYKGVLIGYYNPRHNELRLDRVEINKLIGGTNSV